MGVKRRVCAAVDCAVEFDVTPNNRRTHKYCSEVCRQRDKRRRYKHTIVTVACAGGCGRHVEVNKKQSYRDQYCSDECRPPVWPVVSYWRQYDCTCRVCGNAFRSATPNSCICGRECHLEAERQRRRESKEKQHKERAEEHTCEQCGSVFCAVYPYKIRSFCSSQCAKRHARARRAAQGKRDGTHQQRARTYGVAYMYFDVVAEVLERDGWRCYLCAVDTPQELRGTMKDNAPEVDHVVPLSKGGEHVPWNCRCACRKCNIDKADSVFRWQQKSLWIRGREYQLSRGESHGTGVLASARRSQVLR